MSGCFAPAGHLARNRDSYNKPSPLAMDICGESWSDTLVVMSHPINQSIEATGRCAPVSLDKRVQALLMTLTRTVDTSGVLCLRRRGNMLGRHAAACVPHGLFNLPIRSFVRTWKMCSFARTGTLRFQSRSDATACF